MIQDEKAQWMVISGFLIALSIMAVMITLNEVAMSGRDVATSPINVPYYEMRSLLVEVQRAYKNEDFNVTTNFPDFAENASKILARHGYMTRINMSKNTTLSIEGLEIADMEVKFSASNLKMEVKSFVAKY